MISTMTDTTEKQDETIQSSHWDEANQRVYVVTSRGFYEYQFTGPYECHLAEFVEKEAA